MSRKASLSGFHEWLPAERLVEQHVLDTLRRTFELHGFAGIETRAVETLGQLLRKGEVDKEVYAVSRLAEDEEVAAGLRDPKDPADPKRLALHFDLTVPFARYVVENAGHLAFPFRRYQMQKVWRGERPQEGRAREFTQADIDVVGDGALSPRYDADVALVMAEALGATTARRARNGVEIPMGALLRGKPRDVFIALTLPPGRPGEQLKLALTLHGRDAATGAAMAPLAGHARLTFADARENTDQPRDTDLSVGAAGAWMGQILRVMAQLNAREPAAAREYAETQSRYFHRYVEGLSGGAELLEQMALLRARATREWDARLRKEMHYLAQRNFNSVEDFRGPDKESWAERLRRS